MTKLAKKQFNNVKENEEKKWNTPKKWTKSAKNTPITSQNIKDAKKLTKVARKHKTSNFKKV